MDGVPVHVPGLADSVDPSRTSPLIDGTGGLADSVDPSRTSPLIDGTEVLAGGAGLMVAVCAETAVACASALAPVTWTRSCWPTSTGANLYDAAAAPVMVVQVVPTHRCQL